VSAEFPPGFLERGPLPHLYWPRTYQAKVFADYELGIRRFITVWPRRGGKDHTWLNFIIARMEERPGTYVHLFPELAMGKRIIWTELAGGGFSFLEHFPAEFCIDDGRRGRNESELTIDWHNGSVYRIMGADMPDRLRGINPVGIVFSEAALMTSKPWSIVEPILAQNGGWAAFNSTPQGRDWFYRLWTATAGDPEWHRSIYTIDDICRDGVTFSRDPATGEYVAAPEDKSPLVTQEYLDKMRKRGADEDWIRQEFYCSFNGARTGAYYGKLIAQAREEGRIGREPHDPLYPVQTVWDLGVADLTAIWFFQNHRRQIRVIDYHEESGRGLQHYIALIKSRPYRYSAHWAPHDIQIREIASGKSRLELAREMGIFFRIVPSMSVMDGINAVRTILPRCYFDEGRCEAGIQALENYHSEYSDQLEMRKPHPVHDRWSHGADAFRYLAIVADLDQEIAERGPVTSVTEFDVFESRREL